LKYRKLKIVLQNSSDDIKLNVTAVINLNTFLNLLNDI